MADSSDEPFDALLKRRLALEGAGGGVCPDTELLAALAEGRLSGSERHRVEHHAASCARCTHIVALTAATETPAHAAEARPGGFGAWKWAVPLATAATVAGLWVLTRTSTPGVSIPPVAPAATQQTMRDQAASSRIAPGPAASAGARASLQAKEEAPIRETARGAETGNVELRRRADTAAAGAADAAPPAAERNAAAKALPEQATLSARTAARAPLVAPALLVPSPNPTIAWQVRGGVIERSADGGKTWTIEYTADRRVLTGFSVSPDLAWMAGERGLVLRRSPTGWSVATAPSEADVVAIQAATAGEATVTLADGRTFITTDSGSTWAPR